MKHRTVESFWQKYALLPLHIRDLADKNFKPVGRYWSARIGIDYRALARKDGDDFIWFWIGEHSPYDRLIR